MFASGLVASSGGLLRGSTAVISADGRSASLRLPVTIESPVGGAPTCIADFDADGADDLAWVDAANRIWVARAARPTGFDAAMPWGDVPPSAVARAFAAGDFTGDGRADIAVRNVSSGRWSLLESDGERFAAAVPFGRWSPAVAWSDVVQGDFDGDGRSDLAARNPATGGVWVSRSADGGFATSLAGRFPIAVQWRTMVAGDFDGDGRTDIAARNGSNGAWRGLVGIGDTVSGTTFLGAWPAKTAWADVSVGDFDGDGTDDIAGRDPVSGGWRVSRGSPARFVTSSFGGSLPAGFAWSGFTVGDFNADGRSDVIAHNPASGRWRLLASSGTAFADAGVVGAWTRGAGVEGVRAVRGRHDRVDPDFAAATPSLVRDVKDVGGVEPGIGNLVPGAWNSSPDAFTTVGTTTYFVADSNRQYQMGSLFGGEPVWFTAAIGRELWKTDGTEAGTVLVRDIRSGGESSNISSLTNLSGTLLFVAADGDAGYEIWRSDGTEAGTVPVTDANFTESGRPKRFLVIDGIAYFTTENPADLSVELWKTDGTPEGTSLVKNVWPGSWQSRVGDLVDVGGVLHFTAYDPAFDDGQTRTIWKSDGTPDGTVRVAMFPQGAEGGVLVAAAGRLFANPFTPDLGAELWTWDEASPSPRLVRDIRQGSQGSGIESLTAVGGVVYFSANDGLTGAELWRSDGSTEGTYRVRDIQPRYYNKGTWQPPTNTISVSSSPVQGTSQPELDVSVSNISLPPFDYDGSIGSEPADLQVFGGSLFFTAFDDVEGRQVWRTDGSDAGTVRVGGLPPAARRTVPAHFTGVGSHLYFVNADSLWRTDGTVAGTKRIEGAVPELAYIRWTGLGGVRFLSERTRPLARLGSTLLFSGTGGGTGGEPWKLAPASRYLPSEG